MSKFFDETLKAKYATVPFEGLKITGFPELTVAPASSIRGSSPDLGSSRLEECRRVKIPLKGILHSQFVGSKTLGSAEESYRTLRTRLLRLRSAQGLRSVVITSAVQGEGKTLTSLNLALCCAQLSDIRVLLIDGDVRSRGLSQLLGLLQGSGLSEVLAGQCEAEQVVLATDFPNLYVMPSGTPTMPSPELLANCRWQELIAWCKTSFILVLVDSPPVLNLADVELITAACDGVLVVVRAQQTRRDALQRSASHIDAKKLLGVVFNATPPGSHQRYHYTGT
jgi:protein-tyrosine kinase